MHILHPISHHDITKRIHTHTHTHTHTHIQTNTGADVDFAAALLANHDQQTGVMIHERQVFNAITDLILNVYLYE